MDQTLIVEKIRALEQLTIELKSIVEANSNDDKSMIIDPNKTIKNFIAGSNNLLIHTVLMEIAARPGKIGKYPILYIHGKSGMGKSHLLHALANEIGINHPYLAVRLTSSRQFMDEMIFYMKENRINKFISIYTKEVDVLLIDDICDLKNKEGTQEILIHVINQLQNAGKQLVFTSNHNPNEVDGISDKLRSRLQWGLIIDIKHPDMETKLEILKLKMDLMGLNLSVDTTDLIASINFSNVTEMECTLKQIKAHFNLTNNTINVEDVRGILESIIKNKNNDVLEIKFPIEKIAKAVAEYFKIPISEIKNRGRSVEITKARQIAMYLSKSYGETNEIEICSYFGGRDRSSFVHAIYTIREKLKNDPTINIEIKEIKKIIEL